MNDKSKRIKPPSLWRSTQKTWYYTLFWTVVFFEIFFWLYGIEELCYQLDGFSYVGLYAVNKHFISVIFFGWFTFRQFFKTLNLIKYTRLAGTYRQEVMDGGFKRLYIADEGVGKTLNVANDTLLIGFAKDRAMRLDYYLKNPFAEELQDDPDFKVLKESFDYFARNEHLPHIMANFKLVYEGKKAFPFSMEYINETKRLAEGFALGWTEIGNDLPNSHSRAPKDEDKDKFKTLKKNKFFSLCRQWLNLTITGDEHRAGEILLGFRSVVSKNKVLKKKKSILEPKFLIFWHDKLENLIERRGDKICDLEAKYEATGKKKIVRKIRRLKRFGKFRSELYFWLRDLIQDIGFYKFIYDLQEPEHGSIIAEDLVQVVPKDIPFEFDTRGQRIEYDLYEISPDCQKKTAK